MKDKEQEKIVLGKFIQVYCRKKHRSPKGQMCDSCAELLEYALLRLEKCPFDPKPKCKDCKVHCYKDDYRQRIREVMKFSGIHFVKRGRLDWLFKYFLR
ncbi:MAG: nitrous oxide-stimulated promoter family protein [Phycisphaerae bacterium]|nr:nitrous oxide-stimulated promoter family protein [Phycisphaerae bacterium]